MFVINVCPTEYKDLLFRIKSSIFFVVFFCGANDFHDIIICDFYDGFYSFKISFRSKRITIKNFSMELIKGKLDYFVSEKALNIHIAKNNSLFIQKRVQVLISM